MADHQISTLAELRTLYQEPSERVRGKKTNSIGAETASIINGSPFLLLATADAEGRCDVSPRGGPPGIIQILDPTTVAIADLGGNNLVDSLTNIISNPHAGLLITTPGTDETLRIDGRASLSTDPQLLDRWTPIVRRPKLAIVLAVDSLFIHCAKAFRRGGVWQPASWPTDVTDACALLIEHTGADLEVADMRSFLEADYKTELANEQPQR